MKKQKKLKKERIKRTKTGILILSGEPSVQPLK